MSILNNLNLIYFIFRLRAFEPNHGMTDSKYFTTTKKGEIFELKSELNSDKKEKKKEAVKKVIASMTVGKDVSALFPDVVNCMQTDNLELKKLVYLYLMNYAKSQPDMAIMAVNTFVKVSLQLFDFFFSFFEDITDMLCEIFVDSYIIYLSVD